MASSQKKINVNEQDVWCAASMTKEMLHYGHNCDVAVYISECFMDYHMKKKFWR
jgi:hypothetical protein